MCEKGNAVDDEIVIVTPINKPQEMMMMIIMMRIA